jgi:hypothetical protein
LQSDFLCGESGGGKASCNGAKALTHLENMPVRIVEANHPLPPTVLKERMHIADGETLQPRGEALNVILLKVDLAGVAGRLDPICV